MLGPGAHIAVTAIRGVDKEVYLATRAGQIGEGPFESGTIHTQVRGSTVGDGAGKGVGFKDHGLGGFSVPVGSREVNCVFGARVGGGATGSTCDGSSVGIDAQTTGQSRC